MVGKTMMLHRYHTPAGFNNLLLSTDGEALTGLWFEGSRKHQNDPVEVQDVVSLPNVLRETCRWLDLYFAGHQPDFTPEYRIEGFTSFRKEVSDIMREIPFGATITYGEIANLIARKQGIPKMSAQAVGGAVGWNPICIIVPCHRVMGANGNLTGYGGGIHNKIALLRHEGHVVNRFSCQKYSVFLRP